MMSMSTIPGTCIMLILIGGCQSFGTPAVQRLNSAGNSHHQTTMLVRERSQWRLSTFQISPVIAKEAIPDPAVPSLPKTNLAPLHSRQGMDSAFVNALPENGEWEKENRMYVYGHAKDYRWMTGVLHRLDGELSHWEIRYLPAGQYDSRGGSLHLGMAASLERFKDGDVFYIEGKLTPIHVPFEPQQVQYRIEKIKPFDTSLLSKRLLPGSNQE